MHEHVQKLLDLQKVDLEVSSLTKDIDQLPAEEEKRKRRLDELERAAQAAAAALQKAEMESRAADTAARAVSGESFPVPSAFFTGAKSSRRSPRRNATDRAYWYTSKMNASSFTPLGFAGVSVDAPSAETAGTFFRAT